MDADDESGEGHGGESDALDQLHCDMVGFNVRKGSGIVGTMAWRELGPAECCLLIYMTFPGWRHSVQLSWMVSWSEVRIPF